MEYIEGYYLIQTLSDNHIKGGFNWIISSLHPRFKCDNPKSSAQAPISKYLESTGTQSAIVCVVDTERDIQ